MADIPSPLVSRAVVDCMLVLLAKAGRPLTLSEIKARIDSLATQHPSKCPQGWPHGVSAAAALHAAKHGLPRCPNIFVAISRAGEPVYSVINRAVAAVAAAGASAKQTSSSAALSAIEAAVVHHLIASIRKAKRPLTWDELDERLRAGCGQPAGYFDSSVRVKISFDDAQRVARAHLPLQPGVVVSQSSDGVARVAVATSGSHAAAAPAKAHAEPAAVHPGLAPAYASAAPAAHHAPAEVVAPLLPAVRYADLHADEEAVEHLLHEHDHRDGFSQYPGAAALSMTHARNDDAGEDAAAASVAALAAYWAEQQAQEEGEGGAGGAAGDASAAGASSAAAAVTPLTSPRDVGDLGATVLSLFYSRDSDRAGVGTGSSAATMRGVALAGASTAHRLPEAALLGTLDHWDSPRPSFSSAAAAAVAAGVAAAAAEDVLAPGVWLNTNEPFCLAAIGVQGGGKSHTMGCILESCLVPFPHGDVVRLAQPMTTLVLHFDNSDASSCEATGLVKPAPELLRAFGAGAAPSLPRDKMVILVSPSNYRSRKAFYGDAFTVKPLLFRWASLTADHIKRIMNLNVNDGAVPLYMATMMDILRRYQRMGWLPPFPVFQAEVEAQCKATGQAAPLTQRLRLLESVVAESELNARDLAGLGAGLHDVMMTPGALVIADMTDPLLSGSEAAGIFEVLVEQFRTIHLPGVGKLLAVDEAHKFMVGEKNDGLSNALVNVARLMRHDGIRLAVSTQSPKALAPELLELVTVAVLHRFHSGDWLTYLQSKLPLPPSAAEAVMKLTPGHALVFASQHRLPHSASLVAHLHLQAKAAVAPRTPKSSAAAGGAGASFDDDPAARAAGVYDGNGSDAASAAELESSAVRGGNVFQLHIRRRITADRGGSRVNAATRLLAPAQAQAQARRAVVASAALGVPAGGAGSGAGAGAAGSRASSL